MRLLMTAKRKTMTVQYDPKIISQHAAALYSRAARVVFSYGFLGFVVGAIGAAAATSGKNGLLTLVGGLLGALLGVGIGRSRAFVYQLQAQQALCQVAIELNTRRAAAQTPAPEGITNSA
jgi:hypothetical protein